jgi:hypothetical protein
VIAEVYSRRLRRVATHATGFAAIFGVLVGCSTEEPPELPRLLASASCYRPPYDVSRMESELVIRGIPFSRDGDCLTFAATTEVLCAAESSAFGEAPPSGLNIGTSPSESAAETAQRLAENGVEARVMTYAGEDYVAWGVADAERAEEVLSLLPEMRAAMKQMRERTRPRCRRTPGEPDA